MKKLRYALLRGTLKTGLFFYFRNITVEGTGFIPERGAVLFVSNHQNALIDPLIIGSYNGRNTHFLTRASVFKRSWVGRLLRMFQLIPIYRFRDGFATLKENKNTFQECVKILGEKQAILIFAEGSHNLVRRVRPLTKGFVKIISDTLDMQPELQINIVPVGLNYEEAAQHPSGAHLCFGPAIPANPYFTGNDFKETARTLTDEVFKRLTQLTVHIPAQAYEETMNDLKKQEVDFQNHRKINEWISNRKTVLPKANKSGSLLWKGLYFLFVLNTLVPYLIWRFAIAPSVKEREFLATFRFAVGMTLIPLFYAIQALLISSFFGWTYAVLYIMLSVLLLLAVSKLR